MSFQEKSIWISLVSTIIIFGYYFIQAIIVFNNPEIHNNTLIWLLIGLIIVMIIIQAVSQGFIAFMHKKESGNGMDEREKLVSLKAGRISHFILIGGAWITIISTLNIKSAMILAHMVMFFFILAEMVGFAAQLIYYRKGV